MITPYIFTILIYVFLAILGALNASLVSYDFLPWVNGLRWMRVHFVTLGVLTQLLFAMMPALTAKRLQQPKQKFRWDIWLYLNSGVVALLYGISLVNFTAILSGGTLVFVATTLLIIQLSKIKEQANQSSKHESLHRNMGRKFYISGLSFFLLGIFIGTGLWLGWPAMLQMKVPIEVHIHANNWGLMSLVFAGLLVDIYPKVTGKSLANPDSISKIFWMMTIGATGLVLGPWTGSLFFTVPGLVLHISATIWLLVNVIKPIKGDKKSWTPGIAHMIYAYFWILAPISMAPFVILGVPGISGAGIEANAPQALIYGWVLQFGYALIPYFFRVVFKSDQTEHKLGGSWVSFILVNLGGVLLWASIFIEPLTGFLHGSAYLLWAVSFLPIAKQLWETLPRDLSTNL
jgi:cytochrome c oxidase cbb3-type subunit I